MLVEVGSRLAQESKKYTHDGTKRASTWSSGNSKMVLSPGRRAYFLELRSPLLFLFMLRPPSPFATLKSAKMTPRWPEIASI